MDMILLFIAIGTLWYLSLREAKKDIDRQARRW